MHVRTLLKAQTVNMKEACPSENVERHLLRVAAAVPAPGLGRLQVAEEGKLLPGGTGGGSLELGFLWAWVESVAGFLFLALSWKQGQKSGSS
jgi:hypothetical protein